jgi:hypothetical protein
MLQILNVKGGLGNWLAKCSLFHGSELQIGCNDGGPCHVMVDPHAYEAWPMTLPTIGSDYWCGTSRPFMEGAYG